MRTVALAVLVVIVGQGAARGEKFDWQRFEVAGRPAFVILPEANNRREPLPWVLYAPTFDRVLPNERDEGWIIGRFLKAGIAIAGVNVGESFGSPAGRATYNALYTHLTQTSPKFSSQACLLARSRGGLMLYNWAADHPERVACIAGIYPVCDLRGYPGLAKACKAYGLSESQLAGSLSEHNPVDRLAPLAKAGIAIFHIHGDVDQVVPLEANSGVWPSAITNSAEPWSWLFPTGKGTTCGPASSIVSPSWTSSLATQRESRNPHSKRKRR